jgi:hypothetical protein
VKFCDRVHIEYHQCDERTMSFYVAALHIEKKAFGTCKQYSNAVIRVLRKTGFKIDNSSWSICTSAKKGFKKTRPTQKGKTLPITPQILEVLKPGLDTEESHDDRVFWAAICSMVYGLFRCSEITVSSDAGNQFPREHDFTPVRGAERQAAHIHLSNSKTDLLSQGVDVPLVANDSATCPLRAIEEMKEQSPHPPPFPDSPLFRLEDGSPLSAKKFRKRLKALTTARLKDGQKYTGHSCRRGGAQALFDAGVPATQIKIIGRWKSDSFLRYIGVTLNHMLRTSALMARAMTSQRLAFPSF